MRVGVGVGVGRRRRHSGRPKVRVGIGVTEARQLAQHPTEDEPHALSRAQVRPVDGDAQHLQPYVVEAATVCGGRLQP